MYNRSYKIMSASEENEVPSNFEMVTIKDEPQDQEYSKQEHALNFVINSKQESQCVTHSRDIEKQTKGDCDHGNDNDERLNIFLPEIKLEVLEEGDISYEHLLRQQDLEKALRINDSDEPSNSKQDPCDPKKFNSKKTETAESREKRLIRSKLYYRMRKARQKGEHELLMKYEKEKSKNKLETLEERAKRLESKQMTIPMKKEVEDKRKHRLQLLWQMKKTKELLGERRKIVHKSNKEKVEMLRLTRENKRKARLQHLLMYQNCVLTKSKRKSSDGQA